jgi:hypothetical protein
MQNSYIRHEDNWHLVNNIYVRHEDNWHLVKNAYVRHEGDWHLTKSLGRNLDKSYETPGDFTYKVPAGVYNVQLTYPTPYGMKTFGIPDVTPGQEIPITIGEYGTTSSVTVSSSTYVLPAFDVPVLSLVTAIDGWLNIEFSATSPSGVAAVSNSDNVAAQDIAAGVGAIYNIEFEGYQQSGSAEMSLTPVKTEYITNWPNARILEYKWSGRNQIRTSGTLTAKGNYFTFRFAQNDDPQRGFGSYTYIYNLQQILKLTISPAGPGTVAGSSLIISPSSFSSNAVRSGLFTQQFSVSGGNDPYTWSASAGSINSNGLWSYTPPTAGTLAVVITATDADGITGTITPTLNISAGDTTIVDTGLSISPTSLPNGTAGSAYNQTVTVSGGVAPYSWDIPAATTVDGISISASGGTLTVAGTPTAAGSVTIPYTITDSSQGGVITLSGSLGFTVAAATLLTPIVSSITPTSGPASGGTAVTITGSRFTGITGVTFGAVDATFNVLTPTTIAATTPAWSGSPGAVSVKVYNNAGFGDGGSIFSYNASSSESISINLGFVSGPGSNYNSPLSPTVTYTGAGIVNQTLLWTLSNGTNSYNGSIGPGNLANGGTVSWTTPTIASGTGYVLTVTVGLTLSATASGITIN